MEAEHPISTTLPKGYSSWGAALADARKAPTWGSADPLVKHGYFTRFGCEQFSYRKAHLVAQAANEAESSQGWEGGVNPEPMAG